MHCKFMGSLIIAALLGSSTAFANFLGKDLPLKVRGDGKIAVNVAFNYETDVFWVLYYELASSHKIDRDQKLYWNIWSERDKGYLSQWWSLKQPLDYFGALRLTRRSVLLRLLPWQKKSVVVFAEKKNGVYNPVYKIRLGRLCKKQKKSFFDIYENKASCRVPEKSLQGIENECLLIETELRDYIEDGRLQCSAAQQTFEQMGCGTFAC